MSRRHAPPPPQSLGPTELSAAAAAFEAGLDLVGAAPEGGDRILREDLARHVIEQALRGERDAAALKAAAFRFVAFSRARRR